MQNIVLNIDSSAAAKQTERLRKLHKSALPIAIRSTLNSAAFDVKTKTMPVSAKRFTQRSPNFFKATSKVEQAKGFDVRTMRSIIGFIPQSADKNAGRAVEDLQQQEEGGRIKHRAFIPLAKARTGGSWNRQVKASNRLKAIKNKIIDSRNSGAGHNKGKYISSAIHAGKGGLVISNMVNKEGNKMLMRINSIKRIGSNTVVNASPLYSVKSHRAVQVHQTNFMRKASNNSANKLEQFYILAAQKQIARLA